MPVQMSETDDDQALKRAYSLHQSGNLNEAAILYRQLISRNADNFHALHALGVIEANFGNLAQAKLLMARSLSIQPPNIQFMENYATILCQAEDYMSALQLCRNGLKLNNKNISLLYVNAISLFKLNKFQKSLTQFERLLALQPKHIAALNERGSALAEMMQYEAALASVEKALTLDRRYAEAHLNKGNICGKLERYDEAIAAYGTALALRPDLAAAWLGRGNVLRARRSFDKSIAAYDRALALQPDFADAWLGRGNVFYEQRRYNDAFVAYDRALLFKPDLTGAEAARLHAKMHLCDWSNLDAEYAHLISSIRDGNAYADPFSFLAIPSSSATQLQCAKRYVQDQPTFSPVWRGETYSHERIRVAYLSANFREHPVSYLMAGLFEQHDRSRFETTAISFGPDQDSPMRRRVKAAFEHFIDVAAKDDGEISELIRRLEIDILVDLMGFTLQNRFNVLARRPAPIQVNYLGYQGTMGASCIDYILANSTIIAEDQCAFYTERVVWLPDCYLINDDRRAISEHTPSRRECGLPEGGFVFCCFNNSYKITPEVFDVWMRLLRATENSVLWLIETNSGALANLRREAEQRGVASQRLIFATRASVANHLARHRLADLFLDTLPYNAHTTASDALWVGLPVLTSIGATFPGRVAASLLKAIGLDELITRSLEEYEALALQLAHDPRYLASLKERLAHNRDTFPLFNTARTTRQIESAYMTMADIWRRGESPRNFSVEPT